MMQTYYFNSIYTNKKNYLNSTLTLFNTIIVVQSENKRTFVKKIHAYEPKNNRTL